MAPGNLKQYNRILLIVNIVVALYILLTPLLPGVMFFLSQHFGKPATVYTDKLADKTGSNKTPDKPKGKRLVVPSIKLDEPIHEGTSQAVLNKGVWHRPYTSTPPEESNTVLSGHIFTYTDPSAVFYNLHKIKTGDILAVYWEDTEYLYEVAAIDTVSSTATYIEAPTKAPQLTLFTCTPLWNPVNRLVVRGVLQEVTPL